MIERRSGLGLDRAFGSVARATTSARNVNPVSWALGITAAAAPLYVVRWHVGPLPTTLLEVLILVTVGTYAVATLTAHAPRPTRTPLDLPIALLVFAGVIGIFVAPDHRGGLGIFRAYIAEPVVIYYAGVAVLARRRDVNTLLGAWTAGTVLFCLVDLLTFGH